MKANSDGYIHWAPLLGQAFYNALNNLQPTRSLDYYHYFTDRETKSQRGTVNGPQPLSL